MAGVLRANNIIYLAAADDALSDAMTVTGKYAVKGININATGADQFDFKDAAGDIFMSVNIAAAGHAWISFDPPHQFDDIEYDAGTGAVSVFLA